MMRKLISCLLLLVLSVAACTGAYAEGAFTLAGYDPEETGHNWSTNLFFERMEALTGIAVEPTQYFTAKSWQDAKAAMLEGTGELPDALFKADLTTQETQALYEAGKIIDLTPYLAEYAPDLWALLQDNEEWMEAVTLPGSGVIAALPAIDPLQFNNAMWINTAWLKKSGLPMPTTAQELTDVLRYFKQNDMNGNGKDDEVPLTFSSLWDLRFLGHAFGLNANDYYLTADENGVVSQVLTTDANRALLTWLHEMWTEGLLDAQGFTGLRDMANSTTEDDDKQVVYGVMMTSTPVTLAPMAATRDYAVLPPLLYEGKQVYRDLTGDVVRGTFAITSACKDPATLITWVNTLYTEEGFRLAEAGLENEDYEWNDDGTWLWTVPSESLSDVLADCTLRAGMSMPGYASVAFQQQIDDANTVHVVNALYSLKQADTLPVPMVYLTKEQEARANELIFAIGSYAELQMTWFVTGDVELNDESWADFCRKVEELNMAELVSIFQTAVDAQR